MEGVLLPEQKTEMENFSDPRVFSRKSFSRKEFEYLRPKILKICILNKVIQWKRGYLAILIHSGKVGNCVGVLYLKFSFYYYSY